jgi:hypothetical protein
MKTLTELHAIRSRVTDRSRTKGIAVLTPNEALDLIDSAIADRMVINRWFGFLKMMAQRSSWSSQINDLLDEYLYGTDDPKLLAAVKRYLARAAQHNIHS